MPPSSANLATEDSGPSQSPAIFNAPEEAPVPAPTNIVKFEAPEEPRAKMVPIPNASPEDASKITPLPNPDAGKPPAPLVPLAASPAPPPDNGPSTPTQESLQQYADNPMGLPDDVAKKLVQQASAPAPAPENPHQTPVDPIVPGKPPSASHAGFQAPEEPVTPAKFNAPEEPSGFGEAQAKRLAQEGPDADIGPEQPYREEAQAQAARNQYLDNLIKPYEDDPEKVMQEGMNGGIPDLKDAMEAVLYARKKNDERLKKMGESPFGDYLKTAEDVKNMTKWLATVAAAGWNGLKGLKDIPGQIDSTVKTAIEAIKPQEPAPVGVTPSGAPKTWEQAEAPVTNEGKAEAEIEKSTEAGINPDINAALKDAAARNEADNIRRQEAQRVLLAGAEEGNAQHAEFAENAISHLIGMTSTAPNAALKLMGGPQIGYIDPKLQVALANNPGQPIPILSAKPLDQMDSFEIAAQILAGRKQSGLHAARGAGYVGKGSEEFLKAWNGGSVFTPEQLAERGYPIPIKKIQDVAATANLTESAASLGLTGRLMEASGLNSLLKTSADTGLSLAADAMGNLSENMAEAAVPKLVKEAPKAVIGKVISAKAGHAIAASLGLPPSAGAIVGAMAKNPVSDAVIDTLYKGVGYIPKAISFASAHASDALRLTASDPQNMLATRSALKQFMVRPMIAAKEGLIGMAPAMLGANSPEEVGSLLGMGVGMGLVGHALPDLANTLQTRTVDSAFITDNNWGNSRKPAADPTDYGTNSALDKAHREAINSIDPTTNKPLFTNQQKHTINNLRENAKGLAEVYVLNPKAYAKEVNRMADLGRLNNPEVNGMGVTIDPNPEQNMARILVRSDHVDDAIHHELSHPIVSRMALNNPDDLHTVFEAYSRNNDPNEFTLNYTRRASHGQSSVDYDHLPSNVGIANGTEQHVPGFLGMTKEDMQQEMATEAVSGLLKGGSIRSLTRDPTLLHNTQQAFWRILDGLGFDPVSTRTISPLGLDQSLPAAMVLEPLVRDTLRRNTGYLGGAAPDIDTLKQGFKKATASPKEEAPPPHPDESTIRGLMKTMGVDRTGAEALLAKSREGQKPDTSAKPRKETPAEIAKQGLLLHRDVEPPFTPEEVEKHVPNDATNPLEAIRQAREAILAERGQNQSPADKLGQELAGHEKAIEEEFAKGFPKEEEIRQKDQPAAPVAPQPPAAPPSEAVASIQAHMADPKWVKAVEERYDLKKGSMVPNESGVIHALTKDGKPITLNKDGSSVEGHTGAPNNINPQVVSPEPAAGPKAPKSKKTKVAGAPQAPQPPQAQTPVTPPSIPSSAPPGVPSVPSEQQAQGKQAEPQENAPVEPPEDFTTDISAAIQKKLRENGATPSQAQRAVIGKPRKRSAGRTPKSPKTVPPEQGELFSEQHRGPVGQGGTPVDIGPSTIGFFGYPGDASWDSKSARGIGAFAHSSRPGSMIPEYSAGLKLSEGYRRGIKPGQEFVSNGRLLRWDDVVPEWSPVKPGYVDVFSPSHPPDSNVSSATIQEHMAVAQGVPFSGQRGGMETVETGPTPGTEAVEKAVLGEHKRPTPEKPPTVKPKEEEEPKQIETPVLPAQAEEVQPTAPITSESIAEIEARLREETPQGKKQSDEVYNDKIDKAVWQQAGLQHAESLPKYDTRVRFDPDSGFMTGTHFEQSDPFHQWLLRGQSQEILNRLAQVEEAIRNRKEIFADHASAPQEREGLPSNAERKEAQKESPPENRIEKGEEMVQMAGKHILPSYVGVTRGKEGNPNTVIFGGVSPDKVAENAATIAHELGPHSPYPPGPLGKEGGSAEEDMRGYFENSANGFTGDGEPITPLEGREKDVPEPAPGFEPYQMTKAKSDFWNLAVTGSGAKLSTKPGAIKSANALKLAESNKGGFTSPAGYTNELAQRIDMANPPQPVMVKDPDNPEGPKIVKLDKNGEPVTEPWTQAKLHSGYEMLHLKNTVIHEAGAEGAPPIHAGHEAVTKAMQEKGLPNAPTVKAGFMPDELDKSGKVSWMPGKEIVSPNVEEGTDFDYARKAIFTPRHAEAKDFAKQLESAAAKAFGYKPGDIHDAYGDWGDGAENSIVTHTTDTPFNVARIKVALKTLHSAQKQGIAWEDHPAGDHAMYTLSFNKTPAEVRDIMHAHALTYKTITADAKHGEPTEAYVLDTDGSAGKSVASLTNAPVEQTGLAGAAVRLGHGEFIGDPDGASRDVAARNSRAIIEEGLGQGRDTEGKRLGNLRDLAREAEESYSKLKGESVKVRWMPGDEDKSIIESAKRLNGVTNDIHKAGFILPDGSLLNNEKLGNKSDWYHRLVQYEGGPEASDFEGAYPRLQRFLKAGAVRIDADPYQGVVEGHLPLSPLQIARIRDLIKSNQGTIGIDISNPKKDGESFHQVYDESSPRIKAIGEFSRFVSKENKASLDLPKAGGTPPRDVPSASKVSWMPGDVVENPKGERERIRSAALQFPSGKVYEGFNHADAWGKGLDAGEPEDTTGEKEGFMTDSGRFINRGEAWKLAHSSDQLRAGASHGGTGELDSSDVQLSGKARWMPMAGQKATGFPDAEREGRTFEGVYAASPRFEINDSDSVYTKPRIGDTVALSDILDHPRLYENYPELRNVKFTRQKTLGAGKRASYNPSLNWIQVTAGATKAEVIHEIQHAIQHIEGNKGGTNLKASSNFGDKYIMGPHLREVFDQVSPALSREEWGKLNNEGDDAEYDRYLSRRDLTKSRVVDAAAKQVAPMGRYLRNPGELEAHAAERRTGLTPEQRNASPPSFEPNYEGRIQLPDNWEQYRPVFEAALRGEKGEDTEAGAHVSKGRYMPMAGPRAEGFEQAEREGRTFLNPYDHLPRYEISDHDLKWKEPMTKPNKYYKLGDVIDHPQLFKDYPELKNVNVSHDTSKKVDTAGFVKGNDLAPVTSFDHWPSIKLSDPTDKESLIHEIQHAIQSHEGLTGGTSMEAVRKRLSHEILHEMLQKGLDEYDKANPSGNAKDRANFAFNRRDTAIYDEYYNHPGEIEAREAAERATMTPEERLAHPPFNPSGAKWIDPAKAWHMPGYEEGPTPEHPDVPDYSPSDKAFFMPSDNSLPVEFARNKDGTDKLDKKGKPVPIKIQFDLAQAPSLSEKQPPDRMGKDDPNDMKRFDYLTDNQQKQLTYQDKASATSQLAKKAAVQLRRWMKDPEMMKAKEWYTSMRQKLADSFGEDTEFFSHLLGVTSPKENPHENFLYALEAYERYKRGEFNDIIEKYQAAHHMKQTGDLINHVESLTGKELKADKNGKKSDAEAMARYIEHHNLLPRRVAQPGETQGKLYGTHGSGILKALSKTWLDEPGAPKTKNYAANLFGSSDEATIDSWAARFIRRLGYDGYVDRWRIQPKSETGVADYDFAFAQLVFAKAAKQVGMQPHEAQAVAWWGEKKLWEDEGWMKGMGAEASSLDTPFDIAHPEGPKGPRLTAQRTRELLAQQRSAVKKLKKAEAKANTSSMAK